MASRRSIFAGAAIMVLDAPAALAAPVQAQAPDAYLLWLITRYNDLELDRCRALNAGPSDIVEERTYDQRVIRPIEERQNALFARIRETPATTMDGLLARISMLAVSAPWRVNETCGDDGMIAAIIRDGTAIHRARPNAG